METLEYHTNTSKADWGPGPWIDEPDNTKLHGVTQYKKYILSHIPINTQDILRWQGNIHGHLHHAVVITYDPTPYIDYRYINVSCERIGCTPISFDEIVKGKI